MRVMKFGGACFVSPERLAAVVETVRRAPHPRAVVVSAVSGVTDLLHAFIDRPDEAAIDELSDRLTVQHRALATAMPGADSAIRALVGRLRVDCAKLCRRPDSTALSERIACTGERLAAAVVAEHLRAAGVPAELFSAEKAGIHNDGRPGAAEIDFEHTRHDVALRLLPSLDAGRVPVITGYYGIGPDGELATFGRSGTDYTATAIAAVLGAKRIELWKVVGGFLSADPDVIQHAHVIPQLSYEEAIELSFYGARVLHPRALCPARVAGIPIHVLDLGESDAYGTRITTEPSHDNGLLTAVTARRDLAMIRAFGPAASGHQEAMAAVARSLGRSGVDVICTSTAQTSVGLMVNATDVETALAAVAGMPEVVMDRIETTRDIALVCAVGHGIGHTRGLVGRLLCAAVRAGIEVEMVTAGASPVACHLAVHQADTEVATRAVYHEFFDRVVSPEQRCIYTRGEEVLRIRRRPRALAEEAS